MGVWYYRLLTASRDQRTFVPPDPDRTPAAAQLLLGQAGAFPEQLDLSAHSPGQIDETVRLLWGLGRVLDGLGVGQRR